MKPRIKKIIKRIALGILIFFVLGIILGLIFYRDVEDWMEAEIQQYLAELEYGDIEIKEIELALFQHLPNITVRLKHINFYEQKDSLRTKEQLPILYAENLHLAFEPWELIKNQNLKVTTISVVNGVVDLLTYEDNKTNLERALSKPQKRSMPAVKSDTLVKTKPKQKTEKASEKQKKPPVVKEQLTIDLQEIHLENIMLKYNNPSEKYASQIDLNFLDGEVVLNAQGISLDLITEFEVTKSTKFSTIAKQGPASLSLILDFIDATQKIVIHEGDLSLKNVSVDVKGTYDHKQGNYVDMEFDASSSDIAFLSKIIQEDILDQNESLIKNADIVLKGHVQGKMEDNIPEIDVNFGVKDLSMDGPAGRGKFDKVGFEGEFHSGEEADFSSAKLAIRNVRGQTPGGSVSGNLYVNNFHHPYIKSNLKATLDLAGYDQIFQLPNIDSLRGKIKLVSDFDGLLNLESTHAMDSIGSWSLELEGIGFDYIPFKRTISNLNGTISEARNEVALNNLSVSYDSSHLSINGKIRNLYHFIFNKEQDIEAELMVKSPQLYTSHFIFNPDSVALVNDRISNLEAEIKLTGRDNDAFDSYFPSLTAELNYLSFELDKLPGLSNLQGLVEFRETKTGFQVDVPGLEAQLPNGSADISGMVLIPADFQTLDVRAKLHIKDIPEEYALDLINEMKDRDLLNAKNTSPDQMSIINGNLNLSGVIETIPFALRNAAISNSTFSIHQPDSVYYEFENINLKLEELYFLHKPDTYEIAGVKTVAGELQVDAINTRSIRNVPFEMDFSGANDKFNIEFSTLKNTDIQDRGFLLIDLSKEPPHFEASYHLKDIPVASVIEDYTSDKLVEGLVNASLDFDSNGTNLQQLGDNLRGGVKISGDSLVLYGIDLDDLLRKYERSQKFNLADVSAFLMAGPIGAAVTKGADFTSLISADLKPEHRTYVSKVLAQWSVDHGVLKTEDVAFSTQKNRLAFHGSMDFLKDTIPGFTTYVLDKKGCSLMEQRIYGKMGSLQMGKLKIAKTILGSVVNLINSVVGKECEPVYTGAVEHPPKS
ncbi:MAG: hypothetical protein ACR2MM_03080 [Flavobacteriaceae bacterium]